MKSMKAIMFVFMVLAAASTTGFVQAQGQAPAVKPATLGLPMSDFTLPSVQGGELGIAKLKGKNILLIFPRGKVADHWCQICHYQYAELVELEKKLNLRQKYNMEIVFVLPYDKATVEHWVAIFPDQMAVIEGWKNPADPSKLNDRQKAWMQTARLFFPKKFDISKDNIPTPFSILIDADRTVSKGLGLFSMDWDGSKVDQNIPAVYIIDAAGKVQFKYISQSTLDRPPYEYLVRFLDRMIMGK